MGAWHGAGGEGGKVAVCRSLETPLGTYHLAAGADGVVAGSLGDETDFVERLLMRGFVLDEDGPGSRAVEIATQGAAELDEYFGRRRRAFTVPLDLSGSGPFARSVLETVAFGVPCGTTCSYGDIAGRVGAPRGGRAAGNALARCPVSIIIPCHRIIRADGSLGEYGMRDRIGARARKLWLLAHEGVRLAG